MKDTCTFKGKYRFEGFDLTGLDVDLTQIDVNTIADRKVSDDTFHNLLTQGYFTAIMKFLNQAIDSPNVDDLNINYIATGTGTTTPTKADTKLVTEVFRKAPASKTKTATVFTCKLSLAAGESNYTITEIGTFADGTASADTGLMISRAIVNIAKNSNISYLVTYTITMN